MEGVCVCVRARARARVSASTLALTLTLASVSVSATHLALHFHVCTCARELRGCCADVRVAVPVRVEWNGGDSGRSAHERIQRRIHIRVHQLQHTCRSQSASQLSLGLFCRLHTERACVCACALFGREWA